MAEAKFTLDGVVYEIPDEDDLTMDEVSLAYRYAAKAGVVSDTPPAMFTMLATLHVGIARKNPTRSVDEIMERLGKLSSKEVRDLTEQFERGADTSPPPSESGAEPAKPSAGGEKPSGPSPDTGDRSGTGAPPSATGARSVRETSPA